ncbi:MAG: hypothetical protein VB085_01455 [Peptococcaceae bacterium]|nr:hypothetical protein [Peptococcaceae bacterium]
MRKSELFRHGKIIGRSLKTEQLRKETSEAKSGQKPEESGGCQTGRAEARTDGARPSKERESESNEPSSSIRGIESSEDEEIKNYWRV